MIRLISIWAMFLVILVFTSIESYGEEVVPEYLASGFL